MKYNFYIEKQNGGQWLKQLINCLPVKTECACFHSLKILENGINFFIKMESNYYLSLTK